MSLDDFLETIGLKYDELTEEEKETYSEWNRALSKNALGVSDIRDYIVSLREAVTKELTEYPQGKTIRIWKFNFTIGNHKDYEIMMKARLRNYMLIESYLSTPEKAKKALERVMTTLVSKKKT